MSFHLVNAAFPPDHSRTEAVALRHTEAETRRAVDELRRAQISHTPSAFHLSQVRLGTLPRGGRHPKPHEITHLRTSAAVSIALAIGPPFTLAL